jgi:DNA polymerase III subunit delta
MLAKTFRQMLVILERNVRDQRMLWAALWQGFRVPPFAADDIIKQARRYKSRRDLTRAIRLVAKADLALRSNPVSKRMVLERLVMDLTTESKLEAPGWMQERQYWSARITIKKDHKLIRTGPYAPGRRKMISHV